MPQDRPAWVSGVTAVFWGAGAVLYAGYYRLPFKGGWSKAALVALLSSALVVAAGLRAGLRAGVGRRDLAGRVALTCLALLALGFDLQGIVGPQASEAEALVQRLGMQSCGNLFRARHVPAGAITLDRARCVNCNTCRLVCPVGVFAVAANGVDVVIIDAPACLKCKACVRQCPTGALSLGRLAAAHRTREG